MAYQLTILQYIVLRPLIYHFHVWMKFKINFIYQTREVEYQLVTGSSGIWADVEWLCYKKIKI